MTTPSKISNANVSELPCGMGIQWRYDLPPGGPNHPKMATTFRCLKNYKVTRQHGMITSAQGDENLSDADLQKCVLQKYGDCWKS